MALSMGEAKTAARPSQHKAFKDYCYKLFNFNILNNLYLMVLLEY